MQETPRSSPLATLITFGIVAATLVIGIVLVVGSRPEPARITINPPIPTATPIPSATPGPVSVYVTGAVAAPQALHQLPVGSRVADAVEAAGGALDSADLDRVNLAAVLRDGDQVHVPARDEQVMLPTPSGGTALVYINRATLEELMTLPGIGPALAQRILDHRAVIGAFSTIDDLDAVSGVGPALLERIAPLIVFD